MSDKFLEFKPLSPDCTIPYFGKTHQLYSIIEWALKQTGPAHVMVMTFSFAEEFIRKMLKLKKSGMAKDVLVISDFKALQKTQHLIRFSENVFDEMAYCRTHAKVTLIYNDKFHVTITGSQNATRGNRNESLIISTYREVFDTFYNKITKLERIDYDANRSRILKN